MQADVASDNNAGEAGISLSELQALRAEQARMKAEYDRMEVSQLQMYHAICHTLGRVSEDIRHEGCLNALMGGTSLA